MKRALLLALTLTATTAAHAHNVWLEDLEGRLVVRFAEYGEEYEKSPGSLDRLGLPVAWMAAEGDEVKPIVVTKQSDHFLLTGAAPATAAQAEVEFGVMGKPGNPEKPVRKPFFYSRWHVPGGPAAKPALTYDIVPSTSPGEATVYFRGKALAGVKLTYHPAGDTEKELTSDQSGRVRFEIGKPGLYMLAAAPQRETTPGFSGGKAYEIVSHNASLAWQQK